MLHHRTDDPSVRASHVAKQEAQKVLQSDAFNLDIKGYDSQWHEVYQTTLQEFAGEPKSAEG